jgi:sulfopyruvate decarboxylase TPP-binding subunit
MKAKEFWNCLCEEFGYRLFSGVQCVGFKNLYDTMRSDFLHYIPASNENIATGIISGAKLAGVKGAVLISSSRVAKIMENVSSFNNKYKIPILFIVYNETENLEELLSLYNVFYRYFSKNLRKDFKSLVDKIEKESTTAVCVVNRGFFNQ